jgi:hypothetical protein
MERFSKALIAGTKRGGFDRGRVQDVAAEDDAVVGDTPPACRSAGLPCDRLNRHCKEATVGEPRRALPTSTSSFEKRPVWAFPSKFEALCKRTAVTCC